MMPGLLMPLALRAALRSTDFPFFVQMDRMGEFRLRDGRMARMAGKHNGVCRLCIRLFPIPIVAERWQANRAVLWVIAKGFGECLGCCHNAVQRDADGLCALGKDLM